MDGLAILRPGGALTPSRTRPDRGRVMTVTVDVQWALYGTAADRAGFRVLSCSTEGLNRANFSEVIGRFSPGTPDALPQVTVSYVPSRATEGNYIALAIHNFADGDRDVRSDETGRPVVFTSYFCVRYLSLASEAIGYLPLYLALRPIKLPAQGGPPLRIMLTAVDTTAVTPAASALAMQVAPLLLTGRPVCVLGASSTSMTERLQFIDTVMALLPYGYRARMTGATWVRPTHRAHRFRLYFSDAGRDHDPPDHVVWWDRPEQTALTPAQGSAYEYQRFLEDEAGQSAARLAWQTDTRGFKLDEIREMLAHLGITELAHAPDDDVEPQIPPQAQQATASEEHDPREAILAECAVHAKAPDLALLAADIRSLQRLAAGTGPSSTQRARYREFIASHDLLNRGPVPKQQAARLFDALLPLAFGTPLTYEGYCQVEDCLGVPPGMSPNKILLQAIERCGMADALVTAIVLTHLGEEQKLHTQFESSRFNAEGLINLLAGRWERRRHFRIACDVTLDYLTVARTQYEPAAVRRTLRQHGFLAQALLTSGSQDQYQVHALYRLLQAAYPERLSRNAVAAILRTYPKSPVTPALFAAALLRLATLDDAQLARDAYTTASLTGLALDRETSSRIDQLLPILDQTSGSFLGTRMSRPVTGRGGVTDDVPGPGT